MDLFKPPAFNRDLACIADDPSLAAAISSAIGEEGEYVAVFRGPRLSRHDSDAEVARSCNAAFGKVRPRVIVLAGLSEQAEAEIRRVIGQYVAILVIQSIQDVLSRLSSVLRNGLDGEIRCPSKDLSRGLLKAKQERRLLVLDDAAVFDEGTPDSVAAEHLIVLDDHDPMTQIISANYAHSLGADVALIPKRDNTLREQLYAELDARVSARGDDRGRRAQQSLSTLSATLRGMFKFGPRKFVTFVTEGIPYGYFYQDAPSTLLFSSPHLGEMIAAGIYWATEGPQTVAAVLVDPGDFMNSETDAVRQSLVANGTVVSVLKEAQANPEVVRLFLEVFPYDLFFFCSHCHGVDGDRVTARVADTSGAIHVIEFDEVVALSSTTFGDNPSSTVLVEELLVPRAIDGHDWFAAPSDVAKHKGYVLKALTQTPREKRDIVKKEQVNGVAYSTAIRLWNKQPFLLNMRQHIDASVSPIIFNNSCASFYDAAQTLTFAGARSYVGTLAPVDDDDARGVAEGVFDAKEREVSLAFALDVVQKKAFLDAEDRIYVHVGCHFNSIRSPNVDAFSHLLARVLRSESEWKTMEAVATGTRAGRAREMIRFLGDVKARLSV